MMINKKQDGFGILAVLLLIAVFSLIGAAGFYVAHNAKSTDKTSDRQNSAKTTRPAAARGYLEIKEKGVKFKLTDEVKDAYYAVNNDGNIYFSLRRFDTMKGLEECAANATEGQGIIHLKTGTVGGDTTYTESGKWTQADLDTSGMQKVGDTYYGFDAESSKGRCFDIRSPNATDYVILIQASRNAFTDATPTFMKI